MAKGRWPGGEYRFGSPALGLPLPPNDDRTRRPPRLPAWGSPTRADCVPARKDGSLKTLPDTWRAAVVRLIRSSAGILADGPPIDEVSVALSVRRRIPLRALELRAGVALRGAVVLRDLPRPQGSQSQLQARVGALIAVVVPMVRWASLVISADADAVGDRDPRGCAGGAAGCSLGGRVGRFVAWSGGHPRSLDRADTLRGCATRPEQLPSRSSLSSRPSTAHRCRPSCSPLARCPEFRPGLKTEDLGRERFRREASAFRRRASSGPWSRDRVEPSRSPTCAADRCGHGMLAHQRRSNRGSRPCLRDRPRLGVLGRSNGTSSGERGDNSCHENSLVH